MEIYEKPQFSKISIFIIHCITQKIIIKNLHFHQRQLITITKSEPIFKTLKFFFSGIYKHWNFLNIKKNTNLQNYIFSNIQVWKCNTRFLTVLF